jgi:hypothetical protein
MQFDAGRLLEMIQERFGNASATILVGLVALWIVILALSSIVQQVALPMLGFLAPILAQSGLWIAWSSLAFGLWLLVLVVRGAFRFRLPKGAEWVRCAEHEYQRVLWPVKAARLADGSIARIEVDNPWCPDDMVTLRFRKKGSATTLAVGSFNDVSKKKGGALVCPECGAEYHLTAARNNGLVRAAKDAVRWRVEGELRRERARATSVQSTSDTAGSLTQPVSEGYPETGTDCAGC